MLDPLYTDLISIRQLGPGRVMFACAQTLALLDQWEASAAPPAGDDVAAARKLRARLTDTHRAAQAALHLERERASLLAAPSPTPAAPPLNVVDASADRLLSSASRTVRDNQRDFPADHPRHQAAAALQRRLFPKGVQAITHVRAVEQLALMEAILTDCESPAFAPHVQTLGLTDHVAQLAALLPAYAAALAPLSAKPSISGAQVLDALRDANARLRRVVAHILSDLDGEDDAHATLRSDLLAPILHQHDAVKRTRKANGTDTDADPTTGQDLPTP